MWIQEDSEYYRESNTGRTALASFRVNAFLQALHRTRSKWRTEYEGADWWGGTRGAGAKRVSGHRNASYFNLCICPYAASLYIPLQFLWQISIEQRHRYVRLLWRWTWINVRDCPAMSVGATAKWCAAALRFGIGSAQALMSKTFGSCSSHMFHLFICNAYVLPSHKRHFTLCSCTLCNYMFQNFHVKLVSKGTGNGYRNMLIIVFERECVIVCKG